MASYEPIASKDPSCVQSSDVRSPGSDCDGYDRVIGGPIFGGTGFAGGLASGTFHRCTTVSLDLGAIYSCSLECSRIIETYPDASVFFLVGFQAQTNT